MEKISIKNWFKSGEPWVWMTGGAVSISVVMVLGLIGLIAVRGLGHFWPAPVFEAQFIDDKQNESVIIGEIRRTESVSVQQVRNAGITIETDELAVERHLVKVGNRDLLGFDFRPVLADWLHDIHYPESIVAIERMEWGNLFGYLVDVRENDQIVASGPQAYAEFVKRMERVVSLRQQIETIAKDDIGGINYKIERLRLERRSLELDGETDAGQFAAIDQRIAEQEAIYSQLQIELNALYGKIKRDSYTIKAMENHQKILPMAQVVQAYQPNAMSLFEKIGFYIAKVWEFLSTDPREANTEGGIFPAIFGTVMMVLMMTVVVTPFGVVAALYLHEYASQGLATKLVRVAVNNLAGVPSIVYGIFGLGFFVYFLGGNIDRLFFPEALPAPTFGTGGLFWASLTLALLTLPVVIVSTEEGLSRITRSVREGSLALGATKIETLWRVVIPMASPGIMTGLILAVARAAGEVAPLMLVGVVKLAPSLPVDGNWPLLHLDRKFMHLGFHIYDVGFQSPNVEAARPLVYATALLLVLLIIFLNLFAVKIRNRLREKFRAMQH